jgi:hypothetical protein
MWTATEGKVSDVTYLWPRPGSHKAIEKICFVTKIGDQICGELGYGCVVLDAIPPVPRGMKRMTYDRLCARIERLEQTLVDNRVVQRANPWIAPVTC